MKTRNFKGITRMLFMAAPAALTVLAVTAARAPASTFVGNGGGQGDVELAVTKRQLRETIEVIQAETGTELCRCNPTFENRSVCDALAALSEPERKYCGEMLRLQAPEFLRLLEGSSGVTIRWTHDEIEVQDRGRPLAVDAVTDRAKSEITLNVDRFMKLRPYERVFLLTHELAHLTSVDGKPLEDEGEIGPFTGADGGRRLLNAMGAAAAVLKGEFPERIHHYVRDLERSKSWKTRWLEYSVGGAKFTEKPKQTFAAEEWRRVTVGFRHQLGGGKWGVFASYRREWSDHTELSTVDVEEEKHVASAGVSFRFFPVNEPMTFWGESHLVVELGADYVKAKVTMVDTPPTPTLKDERSVGGAHFAVSYYVPLSWDLWPYIGVAYEHHPYGYSDVNVKYKGGLVSSYLGAGYAF
jgi:hypothetical protein